MSRASDHDHQHPHADGDLKQLEHRAHGMNRLGRRFLGANLAVLGVAIMMIAIAAQTMMIDPHDRRLIMLALIPAVLGAAMVAMLLARPVARDAKRICSAAMRVASGDLSARTGVRRNDELGEAAEMFDVMVIRLDQVEKERSLMLSAISHDLRTPLAALRAAVEAIRDGVAPDPDLYLAGMERQVRALSSLVDDLQLHTKIVSGTMELKRSKLDLTELADEAMETVRPLAERRHVKLLLEAHERVTVDADGSQLARVVRKPVGQCDSLRTRRVGRARADPSRGRCGIAAGHRRGCRVPGRVPRPRLRTLHPAPTKRATRARAPPASACRSPKVSSRHTREPSASATAPAASSKSPCRPKPPDNPERPFLPGTRVTRFNQNVLSCPAPA